MKKQSPDSQEWSKLGAREREILEIVFARGEATVAEVLESLQDAPSYSAVRGMLAFLERKGLVKHRQAGLRYVYSTTVRTGAARRAALSKVLDTFFGGSPTRVIAALLDLPDDEAEELSIVQLRKAVRAAREKST